MSEVVRQLVSLAAQVQAAEDCEPGSGEPTAIEAFDVGTSKDFNTITEFRSTSGGSAVTHDRSGDAQSISSDGQYLALLDDQNQWYAIHFATGDVVALVPRNPTAGGVNYGLSWTPSGNDFVFVDGTDLVRTAVGGVGGEQYRRFYDPNLVDPFGSPVTVQWRMGPCAGEAIQLMEGYANINGVDHIYIQPVRVDTGFPIGGFWVHANSGGQATRPHNPWCGIGGVVYSPAGALQANIYWADYDGTQFVQIEPGNPPGSQVWTHQTIFGDRIAYGLANGTQLRIEEFPNGPSTTDRSPLCVIERDAIVNHMAPLGVGDFAMWWHGHLHGNRLVFAAVDWALEHIGIFVVDVSTCDVSCVLPRTPIEYTGNFLEQPRPTISPTLDRVCWHSGDGNGNVFTRCVQL